MRSLLLLLSLAALLTFGTGCATTASGDTSGKTFVVETMGGNAVVVDNKVVPIDMLPQLLSSQGAKSGDNIVIKAAPSTSYRDIEAITRTLRRASYRNIANATR